MRGNWVGLDFVNSFSVILNTIVVLRLLLYTVGSGLALVLKLDQEWCPWAMQLFSMHTYPSCWCKEAGSEQTVERKPWIFKTVRSLYLSGITFLTFNFYPQHLLAMMSNLLQTTCKKFYVLYLLLFCTLCIFFTIFSAIVAYFNCLIPLSFLLTMHLQEYFGMCYLFSIIFFPIRLRWS